MDFVVSAIGVTAIREERPRGRAVAWPDRGLVAAASRVVHPAGAGGTWLLQRPGGSATSPVIVRVWTVASDRVESFLAKVGGSPAARARIVHEQHVLERLGPYRVDSSVAVPSALGWTTWGAEPVALETVVPGRPLPQWLADRTRWTPAPGGPWDAWVIWLARAQARSARPMTADDLRSFVLDPLATAASLAGAGAAADAEVTGRLGRLGAEAIRRHERAPLVVVTAHHDLGPSNVLVHDDGRPVGVVDWESAGPGLPATDLLYFIAQLAGVLDGRRGTQAGWTFEHLFLRGDGSDRSPASLVTDHWIGSYLRVLALDPAWLPTLAIAAWVMHARNEAARGTPGHVPGGRPARDRLHAAVLRPPRRFADQPEPATSR